MTFIYEAGFDPDAENTSHSFELSFIGYNKSILEVGCSTGYFTKILVDRGCDVIGLEMDPAAAKLAEEWAERVVVGDIDAGAIWDDVKDESFDVVLLGDVLEHLRDPLAAMRQVVRKLKPSGFVITSVPNIAHGDVRMGLLQGIFPYRDFGLLDRTHAHFFTLETIRQLLLDAGLVVVDTERVVVPLFESEIGVRRDEVSHSVVDQVLADPEAETYQFVMKSVRHNGTRTLTELSRRVNQLTDRAHHEVVRTALLRKELHDHDSLVLQSQELRRQVDEQQLYVEALEGHAAGLQHNLDSLNESYTDCSNKLIAVEAQYKAVLSMRTVQMTAPIRWLYNKIARGNKKTH